MDEDVNNPKTVQMNQHEQHVRDVVIQSRTNDDVHHIEEAFQSEN